MSDKAGTPPVLIKDAMPQLDISPLDQQLAVMNKELALRFTADQIAAGTTIANEMLSPVMNRFFSGSQADKFGAILIMSRLLEALTKAMNDIDVRV